MAALPAHERAALLERAAAAIERDVAELAATITAEQGKHVAEAEAEASRIAGIVRLCAEEAVGWRAEVLPMDVAPVGVGRLGYTRPQPTGSCRDHAVQLPGDPRHPQDRARARGRQRRASSSRRERRR